MQRNRGYSQDYREHLSDSQNFITSRQLIRKIVGLSSIDRSDTVLEIGTGKGHLTQELCWRGGRVVSVEIDGKLLENAFGGYCAATSETQGNTGSGTLRAVCF